MISRVEMQNKHPPTHFEKKITVRNAQIVKNRKRKEHRYILSATLSFTPSFIQEKKSIRETRKGLAEGV